MNYLGVDLSLTNTGLAMISTPDDGDCDPPLNLPNTEIISTPWGDGYYSCGLITTRSDDVLKRWQTIVDGVMAWAYHANTVVIEAYAFSGNNMTGIVEIGGIVRYHLRKMDQVPVEIAISSLKKYVCGNGHAEKPQMIAAVQEMGTAILDNNMADAFGLAHVGWALNRDVTQFPRYRREVIGGLNFPRPKIKKMRMPKLKLTGTAL